MTDRYPNGAQVSIGKTLLLVAKPPKGSDRKTSVLYVAVGKSKPSAVAEFFNGSSADEFIFALTSALATLPKELAEEIAQNLATEEDAVEI